jgi:hypothetical protein
MILVRLVKGYSACIGTNVSQTQCGLLAKLKAQVQLQQLVLWQGLLLLLMAMPAPAATHLPSSHQLRSGHMSCIK